MALTEQKKKQLRSMGLGHLIDESEMIDATIKELASEMNVVYKEVPVAAAITPNQAERIRALYGLADKLSLSDDGVKKLIDRFGFDTTEEAFRLLTTKEKSRVEREKSLGARFGYRAKEFMEMLNEIRLVPLFGRQAIKSSTPSVKESPDYLEGYRRMFGKQAIKKG